MDSEKQLDPELLVESHLLLEEMLEGAYLEKESNPT